MMGFLLFICIFYAEKADQQMMFLLWLCYVFFHNCHSLSDCERSVEAGRVK